MPSIISVPEVTVDILPAQQAVPDTPQKVLFISQMKTGTATAGALVTNIGVQGEQNALFGRNSMLANIITQARLLNQTTQFDAIPLADNGAGTAAAGILAFTGPATASGTLIVKIGSSVNYSFSLPITSGQSATVIGAALAVLINANTSIPVAAVSVTGTVTITCVHKGTIGNQIGLSVAGTVTGVGVTLTGFTGGATDPVLTSVFTPITDLRYQSIVWPSSYPTSNLVNFLDGRFNTANNILDGVGVVSKTDTLSNLLTAGAALNSKSLFMNGNYLVNTAIQVGPAKFELDDGIAAQFAALRALRLTTGADISSIVIGGDGSLDVEGGMAIASLPYANTPFVYLPLTPAGQGFLQTEIAQLNDVGISVIGDNNAGNQTIAGKAYTTYKTNAAGNPDTSFEFLNYVDTASVCREYFYNNLKSNYAQTRLTDGDLVPGRKMANAKAIGAYLDGLYNDLAQDALVVSGPAAINFFKNNRTITIDMSAGSATIYFLTKIVVQLRVITVAMQLSFTGLIGS